MKNIYIVIPRLDNSGPVKGAVALKSGLEDLCDAKLLPVRIKSDISGIDGVSNAIGTLSWINKIRWVRKNSNAVYVSFCFSSDLLLFLSGSSKRSICSIRGNLKQNYSYQYGIVGYLIAFVHYALASRFGSITVLNGSMQKSLAKFSQLTQIIPNFIDEKLMHGKRNSKLTYVSKNTNFLFIGGLNERKAPLELLEAFRCLKKTTENCTLTYVGDGPLMGKLVEKCRSLELSKFVRFEGHLNDVSKSLNEADVFVLPSYSEGTSRASMEALYFGLPCIMRNVDSNKHLIM